MLCMMAILSTGYKLIGPSGLRAQSNCTVYHSPRAGLTAKVVVSEPCVPLEVEAGLLRWIAYVLLENDDIWYVLELKIWTPEPPEDQFGIAVAVLSTAKVAPAPPVMLQESKSPLTRVTILEANFAVDRSTKPAILVSADCSLNLSESVSLKQLANLTM